MSECQDLAALIVREADDTIDPADRVRLTAHLRGCAACRDEVRGQRAMREILRSRPTAPAPHGFESRVLAHLQPDTSWLPITDWRRWTLALSPLPLLLLILIGSGRSIDGPSHSTPVRWQAWEEASGPDAPVASIVWQPGMSDESIFVAALTAKPRETLQDFLQKHGHER